MDLITGATGFIGSRLAEMLRRHNHPCRLLARRPPPGSQVHALDLAAPLLHKEFLTGIDRVFHCAGYAHAFAVTGQTESKKHWQVNYQGTCNLVQAAAEAGVQRFVFLSSVKAMASPRGECRVDETYPGEPDTPYGLAKRAAEKVVVQVGQQSGMEVVILRLAMVYGKGGRGNLANMARLIRRDLFPPIPETGNHRSLIHIDDVLNAILTTASAAQANGKTYIVSGAESPSGRELFDALRKVMNKPPVRWSVPESLLRLGGRCGDELGRILNKRCPLNSEALDRLLGSAWYSSDLLEQELGWQPRVRLEEGLKEMLGAQTQL